MYLNDNELIAVNEKTSKTLSELFSMPIRVELSTPDDEKLNERIQRQWRAPNRFNWLGNKVRDKKNPNFTLALYASNVLCGLSRNAARSYQNSNITFVQLKAIEANPNKNHPLKGFVIAAFSQANLDLANHSQSVAIAVEDPEPKTQPYYLRLGYQKESRDSISLEMSTYSNQQLNWNNAFIHKTNNEPTFS